MKSLSTSWLQAAVIVLLTATYTTAAPGSPWPTQAPWSQEWPHSWPTPTWAKPCYSPTATASPVGSASASGSSTGSATSASATAASSIATSTSASGGGSGTATSSGPGAPSATIKNGTVIGVSAPEYNQDFFLGVPYAQPPLGDLRFRNPQSINATFSGGSFSATKYSDECVGYGSDQWPYQVSEDCLYLNIIRPSNYSAYDEPLPVGFWIHGGGLIMGGGVDQRYNLSFIVENGVVIDRPIIGVSINYRLSAWGFLASQQVSGSGNTNMGFRDQRLALHWIQENIAAFGGDPSRVTIWGESSGATSVGTHLIAYGGRDDGLFAGAIMESGNSQTSTHDLDYYQPKYNALVNATNCTNVIDTLQCLREVPFSTLNAAINTTNEIGYGPIIDGDFIQRFPSIQLSEGDFVKVPIIDGTNSDEGISFGSTGINTTDQFVSYIATSVPLPTPLAQELVNVYTSYNICTLPPLTLGCGATPAIDGALYRYVAAYAGDATFLANRRQQVATWAANNLSAYSYRFNAQPAGNTIYSGVPHFQEVAFVFDNENGVGYPPIALDPFQGKPQSFFDLAKLMSRSWASFIHSGDPNAWTAGRYAGAPLWPAYSVEAPMNIVWDANVTGLAYAEADTWRAEGIALINEFNVAYDR